jgi:hypothetical protein
MNRFAWIPLAAAVLTTCLSLCLDGLCQSANTPQQTGTNGVAATYLGFDRNQYPGDQNLKLLRQTFSYAGFWLNNPPGEKTNSWAGKRPALESADFGFLVLFNGRSSPVLKNVSNGVKLGKSDAEAAISSARREGFPAGTIIFLDQEEGGRMMPEQKAYIYTWVDGVVAAGFRAGIYCSGIAAKEEKGVTVITAEDVRQNSAGRQIAYWIANDACPPSPGCAFPKRPPNPTESGIDFAEVWQFAQSPKRPDFAAGCRSNYDRDGSCYPPGIDRSQRLHLDLNTATSSDPSHGRTQQ